MKDYILHLDRPATAWDDGTPLGCGRMGMMLMGDPAQECIYLNEDSIWAGEPPSSCKADFHAMVEGARSLFLEGRHQEIDEYVYTWGDDLFRVIDSYEYAGKLLVSVPSVTTTVTDYTRDLDLMRGVATIAFTADGVHYRREAFSSHPAEQQVIRFSSNAPTTYRITYERENLFQHTYVPRGIYACGTTAVGDHSFASLVRVETDGERTVDASGITVMGATVLTLYNCIATSFRHKNILSGASHFSRDRTYEELREEHIADFSAIMSRTDIDLAPSATEDVSACSVSDRLARLRADPMATDPALVSLYYAFGKYLLVSSSREDSLPANLQGVWSDCVEALWGSDYHTNINLQMNYWHAEMAGLDECNAALFAYMNDCLRPGGQRIAREDYRARGLVVHHISDIYGFAAAAGAPGWGLWPVGGAWLAYHLWEHYLYTLDEGFLRDVAYPFIRDCVLFFMDTLFEDETGTLHSGPSISPENRFIVTDRNGNRRDASVTISPAMDIEIIGGLFRFYREMEQILCIHPEDGERAGSMADRLPPLAVGKYGQLMEWLYDYEEAYPGHRHISHAFALYPGAAITRKTPALMEALRVTLDRRLAEGGGHTGWSRTWLINLFARLRDGERTYENIRALLTNSTLPNLFDTHPPFQIDGNFGGAAGIAEMLLQSHEGFLSLLPALSRAFPRGSFTALRARGGYEVDAVWTDGQITTFSLRAAHGRPTTVELPAPDGTAFAGSDGQTYMLSRGRMCVPANVTFTRIIS